MSVSAAEVNDDAAEDVLDNDISVDLFLLKSPRSFNTTVFDIAF